MKRIVIWVNTKNKKVGQTIEDIKKFLRSAGLEYNIVDICEIAEEDSK
jgi:hypothetical protein